MAKYASGTLVSAERSRAEIESLLRRYGATKFAHGWDEHGATFFFEMKDRRVRFDVPMPPVEEFKQQVKWGKEREVSDGDAQRLHDQEIRRRLRSLVLIIKAKLEAVDSKVTSFEEEFAVHFVMPNGQVVGDTLFPQIEAAYKSGGSLPPLLGPAR